MPKPLLALAALAALVLAGCAGGDDGSGASASGATSSSSMTTTGPPPKPPVLSDTLHLLAAPDMVLVLPPGSSEERTGTAGDFGGPGGGGGGQDGPTAQWMYQVNANSSVSTAEIHVWVEILDTLMPFPPNPFQQGQQCTWMVRLALGADADPHFGCLNDPPGPINPGTRELVFDLVGLDADLEVNETITFAFSRAAFSASPDDSVYVLSGTDEHDSRLILAGLKDIVPE